MPENEIKENKTVADNSVVGSSSGSKPGSKKSVRVGNEEVGKKKSKRGAPKGNKNAVGNPGGGRPTKFDPKYGPMLLEFFDVEPFRKELKSSSKGYGKSGNQNFEREEFMLIANRLPTIERFCMKIGVWRDTFYNWLEKGQERIDEDKPLTEENAKNPEYFEFYRHFTRTREIYKEFIIANGFGNVANPSFAIFLAKNTTDMRDKTETDITSGGKELGTIALPVTAPAWPAPDQVEPKKE